MYVHWLVFLIVNRGILTPNKWWWGVSDATLSDGSGVDLYRQIKDRGDFVPLNFIGTRVYLITNIEHIRFILDNSPDLFNVGQLKKSFFQSFMAKNVGVSSGCPWKRRRSVNEFVLSTNNEPRYHIKYDNFVKNLINKYENPKCYDDFLTFAKIITKKIVFNDENIDDRVFDVFRHANSLQALLYSGYKIPENVYNVYSKTLMNHISHPRDNSLIKLATLKEDNTNEIFHQIPHWIFPINGVISITLPRMLLFLKNHPYKLKKVMCEIRNNRNNYLRKCILETFRLNNPVVTTFRTVTRDINFGGRQFAQGTQFVIMNNPVLREQSFFNKSDQFIPERWTPELEKSYYAIMFNQGPQMCPGKEFAIMLLQIFATHFLLKVNGQYNITPRIDTNKIPQMVNPFAIHFSY